MITERMKELAKVKPESKLLTESVKDDRVFYWVVDERHTVDVYIRMSVKPTIPQLMFQAKDLPMWEKVISFHFDKVRDAVKGNFVRGEKKNKNRYGWMLVNDKGLADDKGLLAYQGCLIFSVEGEDKQNLIQDVHSLAKSRRWIEVK